MSESQGWQGFNRGQRIAAVVLCALLLAGTVAYWTVSRPVDATMEISGAPESPPPDVSGDSKGSSSGKIVDPKEVVVHVAGAVKIPGVYRLKEGDRVAAAIEAAGGVKASAALEAVNLASKLMDGQKIMVPDKALQMPPAAGSGAQAVSPAASQTNSPESLGGPGELVNLNTATLADLDGLPGVGPTLAQRILDFREKNGGFRSIDDLNEVDGIGEKRFSELKAKCTV